MFNVATLHVLRNSRPPNIHHTDRTWSEQTSRKWGVLFCSLIRSEKACKRYTVLISSEYQQMTWKGKKPMTTIKSTTDPVRFGHMVIDVTAPIAVNGHRWDVYGTFNVKTLVFTADLVGSYGVDQFVTENNITRDEFDAKLQRIVKRALRGDK